MIDLTEAEESTILAMAARIIAARAERQNLSGECPVELAENEMAEMLGMSADGLRKRRERGLCSDLCRRSGRTVLYSVPLTLASFGVISPDEIE